MWSFTEVSQREGKSVKTVVGNEAYGMIFHVALKPDWTQPDGF